MIVAPADAAMSDLKPGKAVMLRTTKAADGSLSANNVTVEKDGVEAADVTGSSAHHRTRGGLQMRTSMFAAGIALALLAVPALAQAPAAPAGPPARIRGTIVKLDGNMLTVKPKSGANVTVALAPNFAVTTMVQKEAVRTSSPATSSPRPDAKRPDGTIHAVEVRIFPRRCAAAGEGQNPWDLYPDSVMTNATVTGIAAAPKGETLAGDLQGNSIDFHRGSQHAGHGPGARNAGRQQSAQAQGLCRDLGAKAAGWLSHGRERRRDGKGRQADDVIALG